MPYREVTMFEVKEVLRLWLAGVAKKRIAARLGLDPKTVRRYVKSALAAGIHDEATLTDERLVVTTAVTRSDAYTKFGTAPADLLRPCPERHPTPADLERSSVLAVLAQLNRFNSLATAFKLVSQVPNSPHEPLEVSRLCMHVREFLP